MPGDLAYTKRNAKYYHYDGNGNVRAITDPTGAVVERYDYDAFGKLRNTATGITNDRRYTAEQHDAESGYTFLRARYYDPALGRFVSKDSFPGVARDPQSLNRYIYTQNNPVNKTDPSGKFCIVCLTAAVGAVTSVAGTAAMQMMTKGEFDPEGLAAAALTGAAAGAMAPLVATSMGGAMLLGAAANVAQTLLTDGANDDPITGEELKWSALTGAAGGAFGGKLAKPSNPYSEWFPDAQYYNSWEYAEHLAPLGKGNLARGAGAAAVSNWPFPGEEEEP